MAFYTFIYHSISTVLYIIYVFLSKSQEVLAKKYITINMYVVNKGTT